MPSRLAVVATFSLACSIAPAVTTAARAQIVHETLHHFSQGPSQVYGRMLQASDGNMYGVTRSGGAYSGGTVFVLRRAGAGWQPATTLHNFVPATQGKQPYAGLTEGSSGLLYGITSTGGTRGGGAIFRLTTSGTFQVLHSLNAATDGTSSVAELTRGLDGNFYGTATGGGPYGGGTFFRLTPSGTFTRLRAFSGADGFAPAGAPSLGFDGNFYGTTYAGGPSNYGTIYRITHGGAFTLLHTFGFQAWPIGKLALAPDGSFFGVTTAPGFCCGGKESWWGQVFKVTTAGVVTGVHVFEWGLGNASGGLTLTSDGWLYGPAGGRVYRVHPTSLAFEWVYPEWPDGSGPLFSVNSAFVAGSDGRLYAGTSVGPDASPHGVVIAVSPSAHTAEVLHQFSSDGYSPAGAPLLHAGSMYLTTLDGGALGCGTVMAVSPAGAISTLASLQTHFCRGFGDLIWHAGEQQLFGTSVESVFSLNPGNGTIQQRAVDFQISTPVETADGRTFVAGWDEIQRITATDAETVYTFQQETGPFQATGGLVQASDGHLYGTSRLANQMEGGAVYRFTLDGTVTLLHQFTGPDGHTPLGRLIQGSDGRLYGTTISGGANGLGTVFKIALDGTFTLLHSFAPGEGNSPASRLTQFSNGIFFGTTAFGGAYNRGTVYAITAEGDFATIHEFAPGQGSTPISAVAEGPEGALYGTTLAGGQANLGVLFRLR